MAAVLLTGSDVKVASGGVVSIVISMAGEKSETLPATSLSVKVTRCVPSASVGRSISQTPKGPAVVVPTATSLTKTVAVAPASP